MSPEAREVSIALLTTGTASGVEGGIVFRFPSTVFSTSLLPPGNSELSSTDAASLGPVDAGVGEVGGFRSA